MYIFKYRFLFSIFSSCIVLSCENTNSRGGAYQSNDFESTNSMYYYVPVNNGKVAEAQEGEVFYVPVKKVKRPSEAGLGVF